MADTDPIAEAKVRVTLDDDTGLGIKAIEQRLKALTRQFEKAGTVGSESVDKIDSQVAELDRDLDKLSRAIERVSARKIDPELSKDIEAEIKLLMFRLEELDHKDVTVAINLVGNAIDRLEAFNAEADRIDGKDITVRFRAQKENIDKAFNEVEARMRHLDEQEAVARVEVAKEKALKDIALVERNFDKLGHEKANLHVQAIVARATKDLEEFAVFAHQVGDEHIVVEIDLAIKEAEAALAAYVAELELATSKAYTFHLSAEVDRNLESYIDQHLKKIHEVQTRAQDIGREKEVIEFVVDAHRAVSEIRRLKRELTGVELHDREIHIDIESNMADLERDAFVVNEIISELDHHDPKINIKTNALRVAAELSILDKIVNKLSDTGRHGRSGPGNLARNIGIDVGGRGLQPRNIAIGAAVTGIATLGPAVPALAAAIPALLALVTPLVGAIGVLALSLTGLRQAIGGSEVAFKKLGPAAKQFVITIQQLRQPFRDLRKEAQASLLPGLSRGLTAAFSPAAFSGLSKILRAFGGALGYVSEQLGGFFGNADNVKLFTDIFTHAAGYLRGFGSIVINLAKSIGLIAKAFQPLTDQIVQVLTHFSDLVLVWVQLNTTGEKSKRWRDATTQGLHQLGQIVDALWQVFKGLIAVLGPFGNQILPLVVSALNDLGHWLQQNADAVGNILVGAFEALIAALRIAGTIIGTTIQLFDSLTRRIGGARDAIIALAGLLGGLKISGALARTIRGGREDLISSKKEGLTKNTARAALASQTADAELIAADRAAKAYNVADKEIMASAEAQNAFKRLQSAETAALLAADAAKTAAAEEEAAVITATAWEAAMLTIRTAVKAALISTGVGILVIALTEATILIIEHWDKVKAWFMDFWGFIKGLVPYILAALGPIGLVALAIIENWTRLKHWFSDFAHDVKMIFSGQWKKGLENVFVDLATAIKGVFYAALREIGGLLLGLIKLANRVPLVKRYLGGGKAQDVAEWLATIGVKIKTPTSTSPDRMHHRDENQQRGKKRKKNVPTESDPTLVGLENALDDAQISGDKKGEIKAEEAILQYWKDTLAEGGWTPAQQLEIKDHIKQEQDTLRAMKTKPPGGKYQPTPKTKTKTKPVRADAIARQELINRLRFYVNLSKREVPPAQRAGIVAQGQNLLTRILDDKFFSEKELQNVGRKASKWWDKAIRLIWVGNAFDIANKMRARIGRLFARGFLTVSERNQALNVLSTFSKNVRDAIAGGLTGKEAARIQRQAKQLTLSLIPAADTVAYVEQQKKRFLTLYKKGFISGAEYQDFIKLAKKYAQEYKKALADGVINEQEAKRLAARGQAFRQFVQDMNKTLKQGAKDAAEYVAALASIVSKFQGFLPNISAVTQGVTKMVAATPKSPRTTAAVTGEDETVPSGGGGRKSQSTASGGGGATRTLASVSSAPTATGRSGGGSHAATTVLDRAIAKYPALAKYLRRISFKRSPASKAQGRVLEFYPKGESDSFDPSHMAIETFGNRATAADVAGELVSHAANVDPVLTKFKNSFVKSLTKRQVRDLHERYRWEKAHDPDPKHFPSYAKWAKQSGIPALYRGLEFRQWLKSSKNPEGLTMKQLKRLYTPAQLKLFDQLNSYITEGEVPIFNTGASKAPKRKMMSAPTGASPPSVVSRTLMSSLDPTGTRTRDINVNIQTVQTSDPHKLLQQAKFATRKHLASERFG